MPARSKAASSITITISAIRPRPARTASNVALHYFQHQDPGAFVSISGGGVLASSKHKPEAQAFLKWVDRQRRPGDPAERRRLSNTRSATALHPTPKLVPLADLQAPKVDPSKLNSKKVTDLMTQAGLL